MSRHRRQPHMPCILSILLAGGLFFALPPVPAGAEVTVTSWQQLVEAVAAQPENSTETYLLPPGLVAQALPLPEDGAADAGTEGTEGQTDEDDAQPGESGAAEDTLPGTLLVYNRTVILSGGSVTRGEGFTGVMFDVRGGGRLELTGGLAIEGLLHQPGEGLLNVFGQNASCLIDNATLAGNHAAPGQATITVDAGGSLRLLDGQITANVGGGVIQAAGATASIEMAGGAIHQNTADSGAVINLYASASMTLSAGDIEMNAAPMGAVYNDGIFTMLGGSISGNSATNIGGGVYNNAAMALAGGTLTGNTAQGDGGGIYNALSGTIYFSGGRVGASATDNGIHSMAASPALVVAADLTAPAFFNITAIGGHPPVPGETLAHKDTTTGLAALTEEEAALFTVWDGAFALTGTAAEGRVVLGPAPGGGAAPSQPPPSQPPASQSQPPPSPKDPLGEVLPWAGLAALSAAGAVSLAVLYATRGARGRGGKNGKKGT